MKKLYLSDSDRKIGGVCGGIGEYFDKDPTLKNSLYTGHSIFIRLWYSRLSGNVADCAEEAEDLAMTLVTPHFCQSLDMRNEAGQSMIKGTRTRA
jgi:hypothetical protein